MTTAHPAPPVETPLAGLRVLACGDTLAAAHAGRLLSDLGADVVHVERAVGDPLRHTAPSIGAPGPERSAAYAYWAAGTRSVVADDPAVQALVDRADVLLRSTVSGVDPVSDEVLSAAPERLVVVDLSTYGRTGLPAPHPMSDLLALAASGLLSVNSTTLTGPDPLPLRYRGELAGVHAACAGVLALLGALWERDRSGLGQRVDVSAQASVAAVLATALSRYGYTGGLQARQSPRSVGPWGFYDVEDGTVLIQCTRDEEWHRLVHLVGDPEWGSSERYRTLAQRDALAAELDELLAPELARFTLAEFLEVALEHRIAACPIHRAADVLHWDHLAARQALRPVSLPDGGELPVPGRPWRFDGAVPPRRGPVPSLGSTDAASLWVEPAPARPVRGGRPAGGPLAGVRVLDLTWVWAGPFAAMQLAHLGADVVRVETATRIDVTRQLGPFADDVPGRDRSAYFNQYNQGKRSIALDLKQPRALELLRRLVPTVDVVIDNMSVGALARMGLPPDLLFTLNPRLVAVSMTGFGADGPYAERPAYGSLIDALSGIAASNGPVGGGPVDLVMSLPDPMAGMTAAIATVAALRRARATGEGVRLECSMFDACLAAFPWPVLYAAAGSDVPVIGNRDERRSPHGVFPCVGDDSWVAVAVEDDGQYAALAGVLGLAEPRWATLTGRKADEDALEAALSSWTSARTAADAAGLLRAAGVPAEPVARADDVYASAALRGRDFFPLLDHADVGPRRLPSVGWTASRSTMAPRVGSPVLGQHTREVLAELLHLSDAELDELAAAGVTR